MEEMWEVFLFTFVTVALSHPGGRQHPAATKFYVFPVALLSLVHCLFFSLYSKFVDMTINLSLIL